MGIIIKYIQLLKIVLCLSATLAAPRHNLPNGWPWEQRKHFTVDVSEAGNNFHEEVDIDLARGIEVIRVPQHNNIGAVIFINDYNRNLTMRYMAVDNKCFLSTLAQDVVEEAHENLDGVVKDFELEEELQSTNQEVQVEVSEWRVVGKITDIRIMGDVMQRLCSGHDIYRLEMTRDTMHVGNNHRQDDFGFKRQEKRQYDYDGNLMLEPNCPYMDVRQRCMFEWNCQYKPIMKVFTCQKKQHETHKNKNVADCKRPRHKQESIRCCTDCCADKAMADDVFPYCNEMQKEEISKKKFLMC